MNQRATVLRRAGWRAAFTAAVTATATATALCAPAVQAQSVAGEGASAWPATRVIAGSGGFTDGKWGDSRDDAIAQNIYGANAAEEDPGSLYTVSKAIGARELWQRNEDKLGRAVTGQGVGVAVLDSGVSPVAGLNGTGKVTHGPDLSIEGNGVQTHQDTFGHGTFMAGIIAGRETTTTSADLHRVAPNVQLGVAPDAKILSLKLATADGSTDVSQVIAALDWVTQNPVMPDGTRVRVINLSYGTTSAQSYLSDPLAAAAENAWKHGIVVVTSAGNNGSADGRLLNPAIDPYVIAVGATSANHNVAGWTFDTATAAPYSQVGTTGRHADLVAPGTSLVGTRVPGSFIDVNNPAGLVAGDTSKKLFRGSGTSQASAVVAGSVALLLQAYPTLTPDQVKYVLTKSANKVTKATVNAAGAGTLNLVGALNTASQLTATGSTAASMRAAAVQGFPSSTGQGSIHAARGEYVLFDAAGVSLVGEVDAQGNAWNPAAWWQATSTKSAWTGGTWLGTTWTGDTWQPVSAGLTASRWSASRWSASRWSGADWSATTWTASRWSASRWSSAAWTASRWSDSGWW